ncbi:aldo/keto reductase [Mucilaginibacter calamicampi]|uniref:Aldo/keto reductase n=1 Tax=Mucilaginibacter calamicampi TaxID=1302352 RepID=A0ABW2YUG9_9SPHI
MSYNPSTGRYQQMEYKRCGASGLKLPRVSLGLWQNFGDYDTPQNCSDILRTAFDNGITHFDLANNYGPPPGSAEENFGRILHADFRDHRDELIISTKAGYTMWDGPYGDWGSKKYLVSSLDQSLKRMKLDYVDIFYHHRPDPDTPLEETMAALNLIVQQGKALYIGISNYKAPEARKAFALLKEMGTPAIIHQPKYSMFERWVEGGLLDLLEQEGVGCIPFSPLAQGLLTDRYLQGIPADSRALKVGDFLTVDSIKPEVIEKVKRLNEIAQQRGQKLAQMALSWILKDSRITSVLIGASKPWQVVDAIQSVTKTNFDKEELVLIDEILAAS